MLRQLRVGVCGLLLCAVVSPRAFAAAGEFPREVMLQIVRAEDLRRWDGALGQLLAHGNPLVRERAALAAGRIGDAGAVAALEGLLEADPSAAVRATAAFGLGEIGAGGIGALGRVAADAKAPPLVRARAVEAVGKLTAPLPETEAENRQKLGGSVLTILEAEAGQPAPSREVVLLGITAALRAKPTGAGAVLAGFLSSSDAEIRATAANALARLRSTEGLARARVLAVSDANPEVRANAMRMLGAASEPAVFDLLSFRMTADSDTRVRVSAIRALAAMGGARAAEPLLQRGVRLAAAAARTRAEQDSANWLPPEGGEILEIATALGPLLANTGHEGAVAWIHSVAGLGYMRPEIHLAFAQIAPAIYLREYNALLMRSFYTQASPEALATLALVPAELMALDGRTRIRDLAQQQLRQRLARNETNPLTIVTDPSIKLLEALAAFKPSDLDELLRRELTHENIRRRAQAAALLADQPASEENARALAAALPGAIGNAVNDAAVAILEALAAQKTAAATEAMKLGLDSADFRTRERAIALLKAAGAGDFSARLGAFVSRNSGADYDRAIARIGRSVRATVATDRGSFTIEFSPADAPLTVDNFVQLARRNYFNGLTFHRVVPNFVVQGGDPDGDGSGGPGYEIRCEINELPFGRGAVGMALSGKDTGGSQWFVTHSAQPHLDGGYTVFGRVASGMDVIDRIVRGDRIRTVTIEEGR